MERSSRYSGYMQTWIGLFDSQGSKAAYAYFDSLPAWAREQYYSNHPGRSFGPTSGRGAAYVGTLNSVFSLIDAGNWDAAEAAWNKAPAWMRRRYYANNPSSTLFKGGGGSGGGGIPDAQYKQYIGMMGKWVDLLKDGKDKAAMDYFRSLPKWAQDFYLKAHPEKELMKQDDKMLRILEDYFGANKASQQAMLENNPKLVKWLQENDTQGAWINAVTYTYQNLPDDPWLKRVFREKYPEIFSKEAAGKAAVKSVDETLRDNPQMQAGWEKWYADIMSTLEEALKWMHARPKSPEVDHSYLRQAAGHEGRSAADVGEDVRTYQQRNAMLNKRMPKQEA